MILDGVGGRLPGRKGLISLALSALVALVILATMVAMLGIGLNCSLELVIFLLQE